MGVLKEQVLELAGSLASRAATEQGGVISGLNPVNYNGSDPLPLWVVQVVIIIAMTQFLSLALARIRQPRVIAEVIGGVILGPSVMGHIPGFTNAVFPVLGMPMLTLTSTIGLVLFLFLVGLEIDVRIIKRNIRASAAISVAGLIVPLGLGAALGVGIYREFIDPKVNFGYFLLFTAVAVGITAFPVLCRILTELKLLDTTVGVVVLSAGVGNDVVGWILLALTVALVNASTGITALYVLLASVAFVLFLLYPVRWGYLGTGITHDAYDDYHIIMIFGSAFFTDIIGVHPIFGGFLAGLVIPHENGFAISIVEKLEDLVSILFLPIYFTLSGLKTNLGLLNTGVTWGYIIVICLVAFTSKFVACGLTARATGFNWREAGAIGSLMSCKGLVELIVLNIGLQANILNPRTFSMFVLHALILTFMTTPLTLLFYPAKHRDTEATVGRRSSTEDEIKTKFSLILDKIEQLPAAMTLCQLLQPPPVPPPFSVSSSVDEKALPPSLPPSLLHPRISIDALRLIELTNRTSAVLKSQAADVLLHSDPVLNRLAVSAALSVVGYDEFADAVAQHAVQSEAQMVIVPWSRGATLVLEDDQEQGKTSRVRNPFDGVFHRTATVTQDQTNSVVYSEFIRRVFLHAPTDVALFQLFLPFVGGPDDRLALTFLVQLCANPGVVATVTMAAADTVYGPQNTQTRLVSDTADNLLWDRFTRPSHAHSAAVLSALSRISFSQIASAQPLHQIVALVEREVARGGNLVSHRAELQTLIAGKGAAIGSAVPKTLGTWARRSWRPGRVRVCLWCRRRWRLREEGVDGFIAHDFWMTYGSSCTYV
ncbi:Sodium/hydrogen exchanger family-domain-containing protein [Mycena sp. CBHHK59/15]|nr:Sodium/hydrogen exchanger family-domain-containing protein [Mycena sp. CBHHK59/15]